jgi:serine/threonine-protein kinase
VYRDLKPENLFLTTRDDGSPSVKILDFGIAKLSGATGDLVKIKATSTGDVFGTPLYMSPEQCKSEADKICAQTDVWALGLIAFRLLVGYPFWTADTITHLIAQIAYEPMRTPTQRGATFGAAFDMWFARCCAREPGDRFSSAREAVEQLAAALGVGADAGWSGTQLLATDVARRSQQSQEHLPAPLKQTSAALTRDQPGEASRRGRIGAFFAAIVVGASLGVIGVAWLNGSFDRAEPEPVAEPTPAATPSATVEIEIPTKPAVSAPAPTSSASVSAPAPVPTFRAPRPGPPPPPQPTVDPLSGRH